MLKTKTYYLLLILPFTTLFIFLGINYILYGFSQLFFSNFFMLSFIIPLSIIPVIVYILRSVSKLASSNSIKPSDGKYLEATLYTLTPTEALLNRELVYKIEFINSESPNQIFGKEVRIPRHLIHYFKVGNTYTLFQSYDDVNIFKVYYNGEHCI